MSALRKMTLGLVLAGAVVAGQTNAQGGAKKEAPGIEGTWHIVGTSTPTGGATLAGAGFTLAIVEGKAKWNGIPRLFDKAGEGKVKINPKATPPTIELTVGDRTYKGAYRTKPASPPHPELLLVLFGEPGADFPKEAPTGFLIARGVKGTQINAQRKK
jgi:hypothetical protein